MHNKSLKLDIHVSGKEKLTIKRGCATFIKKSALKKKKISLLGAFPHTPYILSHLTLYLRTWDLPNMGSNEPLIAQSI